MNQTTTVSSASASSTYNCCPCYGSISVINVTNTTAPPADTSMFFAGLGLSLGSCIFVGTSYVVSKKALSRYQKRTGLIEGYSGIGCLREGLWWLGLLLLGIGELGNFLAFGFAPASLVTPLEGLSVVVSVIMARFMLKERLNVHCQVGIVLSLLGAVILVLLAPESKSFSSLAQLAGALLSPFVIVPACVLLVFIVVGAAWLGPRWGDRNPFVFLLIAAAAGPITVFGCKAIGLAISDTIAGSNQFTYWLTWFMIIVLLGGVSTQLYYINRSLALFPTNVVTPINFVLFTSFVLVASGIAFNEFSKMDAVHVVVMVCGFLVIAIGVITISVFKEEDCDWKKVSKLLLKSSAARQSPQTADCAQSQDSNQIAAENGTGTATAIPGSRKKRSALNLRKFRMKSDPMKKRRLDGDEEERNSTSNDDISMSAPAANNNSSSYVNNGLTTDEHIASSKPPVHLKSEALDSTTASDEQQNVLTDSYGIRFVCTSPSSSSASSPSSSSESQDWGLSNQPVGFLAM